MKKKQIKYLILLTVLILSIILVLINNIEIKSINANKFEYMQAYQAVEGLQLISEQVGEPGQVIKPYSYVDQKIRIKILEDIKPNHNYYIKSYVPVYNTLLNKQGSIALLDTIKEGETNITIEGTDKVVGSFNSAGERIRFNDEIIYYIGEEIEIVRNGRTMYNLSVDEENQQNIYEALYEVSINDIKVKDGIILTSSLIINKKDKNIWYGSHNFYILENTINVEKLNISTDYYLQVDITTLSKYEQIEIEVILPEGITWRENQKWEDSDLAEVRGNYREFLPNRVIKNTLIGYNMNNIVKTSFNQNQNKLTYTLVKQPGLTNEIMENSFAIYPLNSDSLRQKTVIDLKNPNIEFDGNRKIKFIEPLVLTIKDGDKVLIERKLYETNLVKLGGTSISELNEILETIPYETERIPQEDMLVGVSKIIQEGRNGKKINGVTTHEPIKEIIHYGVRQKQVENEIREIPFEIDYRKIKEKNFNEKKVITKGVLGQEEREKTTYINIETNEILDAPSYTEWSVVKPKVNEVVEIGMKKLDIEKGDIPFKTEKRQNETLAVGEENVIQEGKVGLQERANISYVDPLTNMQDGETIYGEWNTVNEAVNQIIEYGVLDVETKTETEEIPFEVKYEYDTEKEYGIEEVKVEGQAGKRKRDVTIYSNVEAKKQIGETEYTEWNIETEKIDKVIVIGVKKKETEIEEIPYITIRRENPEMSKGEEKVVQEGKVGTREREAIYFVNPKTEEIIKQTEYGEWIEKEAKQDQIIEYGIKENVEIDEDKHEDSIINISRKERGVTNIPSKKEGKLPYAGISHKSKYIFATIIFVVLVNLFRSKYKKERKKVVKDKYINFS